MNAALARKPSPLKARGQSPASKARRKPGQAKPCALLPAKSCFRPHPNIFQLNARAKGLRRAFRTMLPTRLERDTLLMPAAIAESVVQEAERYLQARLPADFSSRLATRAVYLYPRHRHFKKVLNGRGNRGRDSLYMYMRHWTAGWLKRERSPLFQKLPCGYANGKPLP